MLDSPGPVRAHSGLDGDVDFDPTEAGHGILALLNLTIRDVSSDSRARTGSSGGEVYDCLISFVL